MKYAFVKCEVCGGDISIPYSKNRDVLARRLYFTVCKCGSPLHPIIYETYKNNWRCTKCGVPEPWVTRKNKEICEGCYYEDWWAKNKKKGCVKKDYSTITNNGTTETELARGGTDEGCN